MVYEEQGVVRATDRVATGRRTLWHPELITALESLALRHQPVCGAPALVGHLHARLLLLHGHLHMYHGFLHVYPYHDPSLSVGHLTVAVLQHQLLTEAAHLQGVRQVYAEASQFQQGIVLVEASALAQVEEHVAVLFRPHIQSHVATATGHRFRGVLARRGPLVGLGLCGEVCHERRQQEDGEYSFHTIRTKNASK